MANLWAGLLNVKVRWSAGRTNGSIPTPHRRGCERILWLQWGGARIGLKVIVQSTLRRGCWGRFTQDKLEVRLPYFQQLESTATMLNIEPALVGEDSLMIRYKGREAPWT